MVYFAFLAGIRCDEFAQNRVRRRLTTTAPRGRLTTALPRALVTTVVPLPRRMMVAVRVPRRTTHDRCATRTTHDRCATGNGICVRSVNGHDSQKRDEAEGSEYRETQCCLLGWVHRPRTKTLFAIGAATWSGMLCAAKASFSQAFLELSSHAFQNVLSRTYSVNSPSPMAFPLATRFRS
jgi:hypothetical protein